MNRNTLLLLAVFAVGCAAGMHLDSKAQAQAYPTPAKVQKWQQLCRVDGDQSATQTFVRTQGEAGWELVSASVAPNQFKGFGANIFMTCFKRPIE